MPGDYSLWSHKELDMTEQLRHRLQCSCLENSRHRGARWDTVHTLSGLKESDPEQLGTHARKRPVVEGRTEVESAGSVSLPSAHMGPALGRGERRDAPGEGGGAFACRRPHPTCALAGLSQRPQQS